MSEVRPTVGRTVHYQPDPMVDRRWLDQSAPEGADLSRLAAMVTSVSPGNGCDLVTLTVFQPGQPPHALNRCICEGALPGTWCWPPREPALARVPR